MKLLVLSSAPLIPSHKTWKAYSPYVKEMKIWAGKGDELLFCCPIWKTDRGLLVSEIDFITRKPTALIEFEVTSFPKILHSFYAILVNLVRIFKAMRSADHIHLRCPGNIGLLGCVVQVFFPKKPKTAKYAGNWDPAASQPFSYKLQKWILSSTFLTKNMQVLVYGEWPGPSKNIKPFFTASYSEKDKCPIVPRKLDGVINLLFVGTLSPGKRSLYTVQLAKMLLESGCEVNLQLYGEGADRGLLETYIKQNGLDQAVFLMGNKSKEEVMEAYKNSHFLLLPSKSEGWPKVVAEAMFWGCVPVASPVSCVPTMIGNERRGLLLTMDLPTDLIKIKELIDNGAAYLGKSDAAAEWSRQYTLDSFERAIQQLLHS